MTVGDPKKAIVLAIIALTIVTVAVFRTFPSSKGPAVALRTVSSNPTPKTEPEDKLPVALSVDPFSHPRLGEKAKAPIQPKVREEPRSETTPPWDLKNAQIAGTSSSLPAATEDPAKNTGNSQQPTEGGIAVRLRAIVIGEIALAVLNVAGKDLSPAPLGQVLNGHITIVKIFATSVVIESGGKRYTLSMGTEVKL